MDLLFLTQEPQTVSSSVGLKIVHATSRGIMALHQIKAKALLNQGPFQTPRLLPQPLATSSDHRRMLLTSSGQKPGLLLSIFQYSEASLSQQVSWPHASTSHCFKTPNYEASLQCFLQVHNFHFHKQFPRVSYSPKPCKHLSLDFGIMSVITGIR